MCRENETMAYAWEDIRKFNKYLVFYSSDEGKSGVKGIRADAPQDAIDAFVEWYRNTNRYPNGRIRPLSKAMVRKLMIAV